LSKFAGRNRRFYCEQFCARIEQPSSDKAVNDFLHVVIHKAKATRATVGLPGTDISYNKKVSGPAAQDCQQPEQLATKEEGDGTWFLWFIAAVALGMVIYGLVSTR
jgi:hypothetical protein